MFKVQVYNNISKLGLDKFDTDRYSLSLFTQDEVATDPDCILLRSHNLTLDLIPKSVLAVARAGSGVNNVPVDDLTSRGIPVFNTPGANANAVKELVLAGLLLSARNICSAWQYVNKIQSDNTEELTQENLNKYIEDGKKQFKGSELPGKVLAIIGLGSIGVKVANAAKALGMQVIGFDPNITVERAWELSSDVIKAKTLKSAVKNADFISIHVPLLDSTKNLINKDVLDSLNNRAVLLNFSRSGIIDEDLINTYLSNDKLSCYVTDFPSQILYNNPKVIALPHIGASTQEAEENCAKQAVDTLKNFLANGIIHNSVNFPEVIFAEEYKHRLAIANNNVPNMVAQYTGLLAEERLNIVDLINKSRGNVAYSLIDLDQEPSNDIINKIKNITGVLSVRKINNKT